MASSTEDSSTGSHADQPTIVSTIEKTQVPPGPVAVPSPSAASPHAAPPAYSPGSFRSGPNHPTPRSVPLFPLAAGIGAVVVLAAGTIYFLSRNNDPETAIEDTPTVETVTSTSPPEQTTTLTDADPTGSTLADEEATETSPTTTVGDPSSPITPSEAGEEATGEVTIRNQQEVKFAAGTSSATLEGVVIRAERNRYVLEASAGQTMFVEIESVEDNASFTILGPAGQILASQTDSSTVVLPTNGNYEVIVGPTRGNALYSVSFRIV